jgi:anaerobic ribonucleoside-triphosphate reductase activating protein
MGMKKGTSVNGPGLRDMIWVQGCNLGCAGCFNPFSWDMFGGYEKSVSELRDFITLEGLTISGGEPLLQVDELYLLLEGLDLPLGVIVFTGFEMSEILSDPCKKKILPLVDLLVYGRYRKDEKIHCSLRGSSNQGFYFNGSEKIKLSDIEEDHVLEIGMDGIVTGLLGLKLSSKKYGIKEIRGKSL